MRDTEVEEWSWGTLSLWPGSEKVTAVGSPHLLGSNGLSVLRCASRSLCLTLCDPMDRSLPGSSIHGDSPGQNTGLGCHALLQGIFPTQGPNPGLPHCRQILYQLSHQGSPRVLEWAVYPFTRGSFQPRNQIKVSYAEGGFFTS